MTSLRCQKRPNRKLNLKKSANLFCKQRKYKLSWTVYSERRARKGRGGGGLGEEHLRELTQRLRSALPKSDLNCYTLRDFSHGDWGFLRITLKGHSLTLTVLFRSTHIQPTYKHVSWVSLHKYRRLSLRSSPLGLLGGDVSKEARRDICICRLLLSS